MSGRAALVFRARGVELGYGGPPVLGGVDLTIRDGEVWYLIGPNGSGKTTLLRGMLGLIAPTRGRLERAPGLESRCGLGYVPQRGALNPSLPTTVGELVSLGFVGAGVPRAERRERLAWALARVGLADRADRSFGSLSGGQRQRALLARALVRRPAILVLDEPTEGLDVDTQDALLATLDELHREQGLTLVVVTHRLEIAARHASHVAWFHGGRVLAGPRDRVLADDAARRAFGRAEPAP